MKKLKPEELEAGLRGEHLLGNLLADVEVGRLDRPATGGDQKITKQALDSMNEVVRRIAEEAEN